MSISLQQISYIHPDNVTLFNDVACNVTKGEKIALVGLNGCGKSTLLRIMAQQLLPTQGTVVCDSSPWYVPQHFGQYDALTVSAALGVQSKLEALQAILNGDASEENFSRLDDDWTIEERCLVALSAWQLDYIGLQQPMGTLSGGEKTKVFLAGLLIHTPDIILMDEPTNHLDWQSRQQLYQWVQTIHATLLVVSHDVTLLRLLPVTYELDMNGITVYGGNYDFYKEQKELYLQALQDNLEEQEKALRLARKVAREAVERKQKHEVRGKKQNEKKGVGKMAMDTLQDKAEKSASRLKDVHAEKTAGIVRRITELRSVLPDGRALKVDFNSSSLHTGKILVKADQINYSYHETPLWAASLSFIIRSGDRLVVRGNNGSGKTTLIKLINGNLAPTAGHIEKADFSYIYIDQDYSLIRNELTVYEQAEAFNTRHFREHEIKMLLSRYLFTIDSWNTPCAKLSGGEKMRLVFCCLMIGNQTPDLFILDEPTNNLDIQSVEIITQVIREYEGTVLAVSHDQYFIEEIGIDQAIEL